jgi:hypothetical protein
MNCGFPEYSSSGLCDLIRDAFRELAKRRYDYAVPLQRYELADILSDEMKQRAAEWEVVSRQEADPYSAINGGTNRP